MPQSRKMIELQIKKLEEKKMEMSLAAYKSHDQKLPSAYYALENKIKNLYKKLEDIKRFEYLAR